MLCGTGILPVSDRFKLASDSPIYNETRHGQDARAAGVHARGSRATSLMIALLAQILFCLVAAPVIGAQPWVIPSAQPAKGQPAKPAQPQAAMEAAFDASNVRPEEVSDPEQKKGNVRGGVRSGFRTSIVTPQWPRSTDASPQETEQVRTGAALRNSTDRPSPRPSSLNTVESEREAESSVRTNGPCFVLMQPSISEFTCKTLHETAPAIQPTGPPTSR